MNQKKTFFQYLYQAASWSLLFLILTELALRIFVTSTPSHASVRDGGGVEIFGYEGYGIVRYLPNMEITSPYQNESAKNIVVLGDSFTEARHVMDWQNFTSIAETTLYQHNVTSCNLRNLGRRSRNFAYYLAMGKDLIEIYHPKAVVIQTSLTDIAESFRAGNSYRLEQLPNAGIIPRAADEKYDWQARDNPPPSFLRIFDFSKSSIQYAIENQNATLFPAESDSQPADIQLTSADYKNLIQLTASIYQDTPLIFIIIPQPKQDYDYHQSSAIDKFIALLEEQPKWSVVYPLRQFQQAVQQGATPHGFGNTAPMFGHINQIGHELIGAALTAELGTRKFCEP